MHATEKGAPGQSSRAMTDGPGESQEAHQVLIGPSLGAPIGACIVPVQPAWLPPCAAKMAENLSISEPGLSSNIFLAY